MVLEKYRLFSEFIYFLCVIKRGLASHLKLIIFVHLFPYAFFCRVVSIKRHQRYQNWVENGSFECSTICPGLFWELSEIPDPDSQLSKKWCRKQKGWKGSKNRITILRKSQNFRNILFTTFLCTLPKGGTDSVPVIYTRADFHVKSEKK